MAASLANRYRILAALDLSEYAEIVLEHAFDQAARHDSVDLHFVTIQEREGDNNDLKGRLAQLVLGDLETFGAKKDWQVRLHLRTGPVADEVANLAEEIPADLLVMGRFGVHRRHRKIVDEILETVTMPVLLVGLTDREVEQTQCPDCVRVRAESGGDQWFCAAHHAPDRPIMTVAVPPSIWTGGTVMW